MVANSRMALLNKPREEGSNPGPTNRTFGKILENVYKPGFIDTKDDETMKMSIDKELGELSKALFKTGERDAHNVTMIEALEKDWAQIGGDIEVLRTRIEEVWHISNEGDAALAEKITTVESEYKDADSHLDASIKEEVRTRASADEALAEKIDTLSAKVTGEIEGAINDVEAKITEETRVRATADEALAEKITNLDAKITNEVEGALTEVAANLKKESEARTTADEALAKDITSLDSKFTKSVGDLKTSTEAAIKKESETRATADAAMAKDITALDSKFTGSINGVKTELEAKITTEATTRADADKALSTLITKVEADYKAADAKVAATAHAEVTTESTARASGDSALASQITTVQTSLGKDIAGVKVTAETAITKAGNAENAANHVMAKWGVSVDANGHVAGISLNNDSKTSEFNILADKFSFTNGATNKKVFRIEGDVIYMDGTVYAQNMIGDLASIIPYQNSRVGLNVDEVQLKGFHINHARPYDRMALAYLGVCECNRSGTTVRVTIKDNLGHTYTSSQDLINSTAVPVFANFRVPANTVPVFTVGIRNGVGGYLTGGTGAITLYKASDEITVA